MFDRLRRQMMPKEFRTRSAARDQSTDAQTIQAVGVAISNALKKFEEEEAGLKLRMEDAKARASLAVGNDTYEHLTREDTKSEHLHEFEGEMSRAGARLAVLHQHLTNLKFIQIALVTRFPDLPRA